MKLIGLILNICLISNSCKKGTTQQNNVVTEPITYFVSSSGNDNNSGTSTNTAWKTIAKVNSCNFSPGDQILFQDDEIFSGNLVATSSGAKKAYIRYGSYGTGRAYVNASSGTGVYVHDKSYVWIDKFIIYGSWDSGNQSGNNGTGIYFCNDLSGSDMLGNCHVSSCDVSGFKNAGIEAFSGSTASCQNGYSQIIVDSNTVHDNGIYGITTLGSEGSSGSTSYAFPYVYIGYNIVYNNYGLKVETSNHTGDGILIGDAGSGVIEHNVAYNNGWYCNSSGGGPAAIWCYDATGLMFQYNEAYNNGTGTGKADGDGFDLDGGVTNCIMQYNYSHNNYAAGYLIWEYGDNRVYNGGNVLRYNISQNDSYGNSSFYGGITTGLNCNNNEYYNNTIYSTVSLPVNVKGGTGNGFYNNILYGNSSAGILYCSGNTGTAWFFNNDYYGGNHGVKFYVNDNTYTSLSDFRRSFNEVYNGGNYGYAIIPSLNDPGNGGTIGTGTPSTLTSYKLNRGSGMINSAFDLTKWGLSVGSIDFN